MIEIEKDIGSEVIEKLKELDRSLDNLLNKQQENKNSQIHLFLETDLLNSLKLDSEKEGITVSELCRRRLRESQNFKKLQKDVEIMKIKLDKVLSKKTK